MKHLSRRLPAFIILIHSFAALGFAQSANTGAISGTITDAKGAVVAEATITAVDLTTGEKRSGRSSSQGIYLVPLLPPSTYRVEISKDGFKLSVNENIAVHVTETATLNVQLEVGAAVQTVEVRANSVQLKTRGERAGRCGRSKRSGGASAGDAELQPDSWAVSGRFRRDVQRRRDRTRRRG